MLKIPVVDLHHYKVTGSKAECEKAADSLHRFGVFCVRDERAADSDNDAFLDMMERYFESADFLEDARPEYHYQVGVTPEGKERARNHCARVEKLEKQHVPVSLCPPEADKKSRFFWRVGERPSHTAFQELNADPVIPRQFPEWENIMNMWGHKMLDTITDLVELVALGLGLDKDALANRIKFGPHLLAPTGSNFHKFNQLNDVLAAYHYDLNLLTIHGKSRFPGLFIWLRDGTRTAVTIPDGCLLVQAGKQMEYLTGGYIQAGFHEVIVADSTLRVITQRKLSGKSLWRVSSTLFAHTASDTILEPLAHFATPEACRKYPSILAGNQVLKELSQIDLGTAFHRQTT
ncbi:putative oxoglutarate/iron-dependent dioxygenase, isopenicillin N synthase [Plasmopara halstedii]